MQTVGKSKLCTFLSPGWSEKEISNTVIREDHGFDVRTFPSLVQNVASLSFYNRDLVLLFRGQAEDFRNQDQRTSIHPTIFRGRGGENTDEWNNTLANRYWTLRRAEELLSEEWETRELPDLKRVQRHRSLRWSILQHYEICLTPLLDVTQSLRVAASFALKDTQDDEAYVYVLGVPQISGAITASAEAELQVLRLASMCPPQATRAHFQEGFLLGNYPEIHTATEKQNYGLLEVDFARRLICKFRLIEHKTFWKAGFPAVPDNALFPNKHDKLVAVANAVRGRL